MKISLEQLDQELINNLSFWMQHALDSSSMRIFPAVFPDGTPDTSANMGSMFLSRILYGASTACHLLKSNNYAVLADSSYAQLQELRNPKGGYYWAKDATNNILQDDDNTNMAQAFALYGLVAYAGLKPSEALDAIIEKQKTFIQITLADKKYGGYMDGFDMHWKLGKTPTKALGTHLHLLEAFVMLYQYKKNEALVNDIESLIKIIMDKFITKDTFDCLHRLTPDWEPLPNEIWAGHNAECSWILCRAAKAIANKKLQADSNKLAMQMMSRVIANAYDNKNGGVFNALQNNEPAEYLKIWWPQAETVIALLNCHEISKEKIYKNLARELVKFIRENFIASNGEWYTEILQNGKPNPEIPMLHFWKSMYHTVRYYAEIKARLQ